MKMSEEKNIQPKGAHSIRFALGPSKLQSRPCQPQGQTCAITIQDTPIWSCPCVEVELVYVQKKRTLKYKKKWFPRFISQRQNLFVYTNNGRLVHQLVVYTYDIKFFVYTKIGSEKKKTVYYSNPNIPTRVKCFFLAVSGTGKPYFLPFNSFYKRFSHLES